MCQIKPKLIQFNKLAASIRPIPTKHFYLFSGVMWLRVLAFPPSTLLSVAPNKVKFDFAREDCLLNSIFLFSSVFNVLISHCFELINLDNLLFLIIVSSGKGFEYHQVIEYTYLKLRDKVLVSN